MFSWKRGSIIECTWRVLNRFGACVLRRWKELNKPQSSSLPPVGLLPMWGEQTHYVSRSDSTPTDWSHWKHTKKTNVADSQRRNGRFNLDYHLSLEHTLLQTLRLTINVTLRGGVYGRGCFLRRQEVGERSSETHQSINHSALTSHVLHEALHVLTVHLRCHPHVTASQQGCVDLMLLLLQSITDGCMGAEEGREGLRQRKQTLFIDQLNFKTTKETLKQQHARTTTSSADANEFHSSLLWPRILFKTYTLHTWSPLWSGSLLSAKFTVITGRGNEHRRSVWDWFMKNNMQRHTNRLENQPKILRKLRWGWGALFLRDLIICWIFLQKVAKITILDKPCACFLKHMCLPLADGHLMVMDTDLIWLRKCY